MPAQNIIFYLPRRYRHHDVFQVFVLPNQSTKI
jgi:hypothetical protein